MNFVQVPVADLHDAPQGSRISQLLFGEPFTIEKTEGGFAFGRTECGYNGWVTQKNLGFAAPNARIGALASYLFAAADLKSEPVLRLSYGARLEIIATKGEYSQTPQGWIYTAHLADPALDYVSEAEKFIGTPYLWGGRSSLGLDCSALVQLTLCATGIPCPRDSDMQENSVGDLSKDAPQRGDLVFWAGHVGIVQSPTRMLHANAHHMMVTSEPLAQASKRIAASGGGAIRLIRRVWPRAVNT